VNLELTHKAEFDLDEIWRYTADEHGLDQAELYLAFLLLEMNQLISEPTKGKVVPEFPQLRCLQMKWRPKGHGHLAFYETLNDAIRVVRVLHTAMDLPEHLAKSQ